jgi:glycosyltransferase involved in cell wall biosynthesis
MEQPSISVIILTFNEELNLPIALESVSQLTPSIFVVDSGSTDRTVEIARAAGANVVHHEFENQGNQINWAIDNLPIQTDWVMRLDADERLTPELVRELHDKLPLLPYDVYGLLLKCRVYFWGRWIRHGDFYPMWLLRIWRRGLARCEERFMDEHMAVSSDRTLSLEHDIIDENQKGLGFWTLKHNKYADREVLELLSIKQGKRSSDAPAAVQARRRRWLKERLYVRLPLFIRPLVYWFYRYFLRAGFLDGRPGLVFHFLQAFWYRFLVDAKLWEASYESSLSVRGGTRRDLYEPDRLSALDPAHKRGARGSVILPR